jgi:glycosyltransferase involved in cell wall biosynthesis
MHALFIVAVVLAWLVALAWTRVTLTALYHLPRIPNLLDPRYNPVPHAPGAPSSPQPAFGRDQGGEVPQITVIVPARNEAASIDATLRSLLNQTIPIEIIAIDDRSTDQTGALMDSLSAQIAAESRPLEVQAPGKSFTVLHVDHLPEGWMGKTHAMALAARQTATPWLLFTDGDILFRQDTLERALRFAHESQADHVALALTLILNSAGERLMTTVIGCFTLLSFRPWKTPDPAAKHDSVGVGAFNLIRSSAYRAIGGFESLRMEVLEDLRLGFEVKHRGFRQHVVFGRDLIRVHWAAGALGMAHNLTKNFFAVFRFRPAALMAGVLALALLFFAPFVGLFAPWPIRGPGIVALAMIALAHRYSSRHFTGISILYVLTLPIGAALLIYSLLRSMILTLWRGGVIWRGTFYPLNHLRRHAGPLR